MTAEQKEALIEAYLLLETHFSHSLIVVSDSEIPGTMPQPQPNAFWSGGWIVAKHMANDAVTQIERRKPITRCPPNE